MSTEYILGTDREELARLELQHNLWRDELLRLLDFSNLKKSARILDLGCGPGFTSFDLLKYSNQNSKLTSIDISDKFLKSLQNRVTQENLENRIEIKKSPIEDLNLEFKNYDSAFCRWLLIFVGPIEKTIQSVHQHLKPGAEFIIQEYSNYDTMNLVPASESIKPVLSAIFKSWRDQGGEPNRGQTLPHLLEENGFKVTHIEARAKFASPSEALWQWPDSYFKSFIPRLVSMGYLSSKMSEDFFQDWNNAKNIKGSYYIAPTVVNIIAKKI